MLIRAHADKPQFAPDAPDDWKLIAVSPGFHALMSALERAHRKGYMPDSMTEDWEAFDYREVDRASVGNKP